MRVHTVLANLLYPPACLLCHGPLPAPRDGHDDETRQTDRVRSGVVCGTCVSAMPRNGPPICSRCGLELPGAFDAIARCASCRKTPLAFEVARAPWRYTGLAQEAVRRFKYQRRWRIGRWLADDMVSTARASLPLDEVAVVLPVPLHWLKRRLNGFNAAEHLASAVAQALEKPYAPRALSRARWTATQTRLPWGTRFRNVRGAFTARERLLTNRTVLLIDDVLTSGATVNACTLALKAAGARRVMVLTAARTSRA